MKNLRRIVPLFLILLCFNQTNALEISVIKGNWGKVSIEEIEKLLDSTAKIFLPYSHEIKDKIISVQWSSSTPMLHYDQTENGVNKIKLTAKDRYWCQYAFQFSHEIGHLMCNTKRGNRSNQWFEESLCEVASLFALKELFRAWSKKPPYSNWKSYAIEFKKYRDDRIKKSSYPENFQLSSWWNHNKKTLSRNPNLRKQNLWVAINLLTLFEKAPEISWSACAWINYSKNQHPNKFEQYLKNWKSACPKMEQKKFVQNIIESFGIN